MWEALGAGYAPSLSRGAMQRRLPPPFTARFCIVYAIPATEPRHGMHSLTDAWPVPRLLPS
jgi:hypothetical protein